MLLQVASGCGIAGGFIGRQPVTLMPFFRIAPTDTLADRFF
jgi:hypothetical protein